MFSFYFTYYSIRPIVYFYGIVEFIYDLGFLGRCREEGVDAVEEDAGVEGVVVGVEDVVVGVEGLVLGIAVGGSNNKT